jgi:hypothetical protein
MLCQKKRKDVYYNAVRIKKEIFMKHCAYLPEDKTLCVLPLPQRVGWSFVEGRDKPNMRLRKGQQYSLFKNSVTCPECLEFGKFLMDNICSSCGTKLE